MLILNAYTVWYLMVIKNIKFTAIKDTKRSDLDRKNQIAYFCFFKFIFV